MEDQSENRLPYEYWDDQEHQKLVNNFSYHAPISNQHIKYETLRIEARRLAELILGYCPPSRERSLAFTKLEEAIMWANSSIARNEKLGEK